MRIALAALTLLTSGCFPAVYNPKTVAGADCKKSCALEMGRCDGSSYTCDRAYSRCISACKDMDLLGGK